MTLGSTGWEGESVLHALPAELGGRSSCVRGYFSLAFGLGGEPFAEGFQGCRNDKHSNKYDPKMLNFSRSHLWRSRSMYV